MDLNWREMTTLVPLAVLVFWIGLFPNPVLTVMHGSVNELIEQVDRGDVLLAEGESNVIRSSGHQVVTSSMPCPDLMTVRPLDMKTDCHP